MTPHSPAFPADDDAGVPDTPGDTSSHLQQPDAQALADLSRTERFFEALAASLDGSGPALRKLVLAKPRKTAGDLAQLQVRPVSLRGETALQFVEKHTTRDLTRNLPPAAAQAELRELLATSFSHAHLITTGETLQLSISKRGKVGLHRARTADSAPDDAAPAPDAGEVETSHNRAKRRWLDERLPFLHALGVTDAGGHVVPAMARKWKQINKFVEIIDHAVETAGLAPTAERPLEVVDFGAGKGYLTFATHHHLSHGRGWPVHTHGVELRQALVDTCNDAARRCGMDGLEFVCGDVATVTPKHVDLMIALHACDTATDHALHAGIRAGAAVIVSSPCCHKQLRPQMNLPPVLKPMLHHGIHLGQQAEMLTDSLRALLLEAHGYEAQVFEFVALEHTSKNKMILATRRSEQARRDTRRRDELLRQVAEIKAYYGIREHALESLLLHGEPA